MCECVIEHDAAAAVYRTEIDSGRLVAGEDGHYDALSVRCTARDLTTGGVSITGEAHNGRCCKVVSNVL